MPNLLIFLSIVSLSKEENSVDGKISVVTTNFIGYDICVCTWGRVFTAGCFFEVGVESHTYEGIFRDIMMIKECDVLVYGGGESDEWVRKILESVDTSKMKLISLVNQVETIEEEDGDVDEHVWIKLLNNVVLIAQKIGDLLGRLDLNKKEEYDKRMRKYCVELNGLDLRVSKSC